MKLVEKIFATLEGEGINIGVPTIFIRFFGCNKRCGYCDTKYSYEDEFIEITPEKLAKLVLEEIYNSPRINRISITGGEPLVQADAVGELIFHIKTRLPSIKINLETNGSILHPKIFQFIDEISCDVKGPSSGESSSMEVIQYLEENYIYKTHFKFVVSTQEDIDFLKKFDMLPNKIVMKDSYSKIALPIIVDSVKSTKYTRFSPRLQEMLKIK